MTIFSNKKHTSKLYKVVANSIKSDQMISKGGGKKQSKKTSMGDRKYDPMLSITGNQGLSVKGTVDMMIAKAIK
jgi:hypothetical protein|tara:strand:+ start:6717 stop:6938 length:222 start_codon:yes stop_codon:yes gene_type:complete